MSGHQHIGVRVGGEPTHESDHFIVCTDCGQAIDCRDLGQVLHHEEPGHEREVKQ